MSDLDFDPATLVYELDLHILIMYLCTRIEVCRLRLSKVRKEVCRLRLSKLEAKQDRQTDGRDQKHYYLAFVGGNKSC